VTRAPSLNEIDVAGLSELITERDDLVFVDVRESEEYAAGHIPGAISAPTGTLEHATDEESVARNEALLQARELVVVVYCENGRRSRASAEQLLRRGFTQIYWLVDGLKSWQSSGLPLLHKEARTPRRR
jgi:rhodanese-related sulfurtransferase